MTPQQKNPPPRRPPQRSKAVTRPPRRFRGSTITWIAIGVVLVVVLAVVLVTELKSAPPTPKGAGQAVPASVMAELTGVPASAFNTIGINSGQIAVLTAGGWFQKKGQPALTDPTTKKPEVLYVGAEYCPYCAASRWGFIVALARFGTFSNLEYMFSSSTDVYPNTPTFTFLKASYSSPYITFDHFETTTRNENQPLQQLSSQASAAASKYDTEGSIPFLDIDNRYFLVGSAYDPTYLAGSTQAQIASGLSDPSIGTTKAILTEANIVSAEICAVTHGKPSMVCSSPGVKAASAVLSQLPTTTP